MVRGLEDRIFNAVIYLILGIVGIICVFPLLYVLAVSVTPYGEVLKNGGYIIIPKSFTLEAYHQLFSGNEIVKAFGITVFITVVGTLVNMFLTTFMAYPLSRKDLPGRNFFLFLVVFTLLFSGGIIPTYLVVRDTGLVDTVWAMIIPNAVGAFNLLIMKSFFENIPNELFDSARIDGAKEFRILFQIVMPLSLPVLLTVGLFYAVGHWNEFFQAVMYITDTELYPLQVVIRNILMQSTNPEQMLEEYVPTTTLQMAAVIVASLPIIVVYPFIQKHFTKGVMIGSIKG
ncbi:ABC transporter permease [Bacillus sp. SA1-12]|uniref:carbohydrate ABC transporter permease n=1 Tax=Bacillus sp. SA1-12 TaxID=1455638 RepID=UPI00062707D9|nr:carbohydrate ABC transporter permease [Bacillus sp. SA1-12]KKI90587.1 ABC transporter permease [Bacillus sp. SA1-12]